MEIRAMNLTKFFYYLAVIVGFQASVFFIFILITDASGFLIEGKTGVIPILLMMVFTVGGYVLTFSKQIQGSLIMISGGFIMAVYLIFLGGIGEYQMALIFGLPFIIPGLIFYFTSNRKPMKS
jgi:hypothetical protein